jgi:predicted acyltransferase
MNSKNSWRNGAYSNGPRRGLGVQKEVNIQFLFVSLLNLKLVNRTVSLLMAVILPIEQAIEVLI